MLDKLKLLLGIASDDDTLDDKLTLILSLVTARLTLLLGGTEPPEEMDHIIIEVAAIRFNRIGSEGMTSHTVEGESLSFTDDDFSQFADEIGAWLDEQENTKKGRVRFI